MLIKDFLNKVYKSKKDGTLSKVAISFMVKHSLKENEDKNPEELIMLSQHLSNVSKRIEIVSYLLQEMSSTKDSRYKIGDWRKKTYKQVAKELHPDSDTGDTESFQFLQEIKEFLWDCDGNPRSTIQKFSWSAEKDFNSKSYNKYDKYRK